MRLEQLDLEVAVAKAVVLRKNSKPPSAVRPKLEQPKRYFGLAAILSQAREVADAFGPVLGFIIMVLAILAGSGVSVTGLVLLANGIGQLL